MNSVLNVRSIFTNIAHCRPRDNDIIHIFYKEIDSKQKSSAKKLGQIPCLNEIVDLAYHRMRCESVAVDSQIRCLFADHTMHLPCITNESRSIENAFFLSLWA